MKRLIAVALIVNAVLLVVVIGLLCKEQIEVVHAAGGGGTPKGNGDVNGDGTIDISDAVALLNWLFLGGKEPVAIECPPPDVPQGFTPLGKNAQGYEEYRHDQTGIVFVRLPGGKFNMGSPDTEANRYSEEGPVHEVTLSPFLIAKYEVTQAQWTAVMGSNPSYLQGDNTRPVEQVSWEYNQGFETATGLALPTEAQWEYACRAGTAGPYAGTGNLDDMGWYWNNSGNTTHPVGQKAPNGFGIHDMHGNVWEWCEDVYDGVFYSKPEAGGPNPLSLSGSGGRVVRGGSWDIGAGLCRSAGRDGSGPSARFSGLGFRPARPLP